MIIYWIKVQPYNPANKYEGKNIISNGSNETSVEFRMNNRYQYQIYIIKTTEQDSPA